MGAPRPLHLAEYGFARALLAGALSLSPARALALARGAADLLYRLDRRHRERALANLAMVFPEMPESARRAIARSSFRSFACTVVESLFLPRLGSGPSLRRHFEFHLDPEAAKAARRGKGGVFATAHIGNWEWTGTASRLFGFPVVSVARPLANPYLTRYMTGIRERMGQRIVMKRGALRELAVALRQGLYLGFLADQSAGRHGVFAEFFGRPASTPGAPATLALKYDVPLLPVWQRRLPGDFRHEITVEAPLVVPRTGDLKADVLALTRAINARVEDWVRREPGQWLWAHRRWKTRPPEEESGCPSNPSTSHG
jgi:KDO2-lipid IV(A) lauroyltransferase